MYIADYNNHRIRKVTVSTNSTLVPTLVPTLVSTLVPTLVSTLVPTPLYLYIRNWPLDQVSTDQDSIFLQLFERSAEASGAYMSLSYSFFPLLDRRFLLTTNLSSLWKLTVTASVVTTNPQATRNKFLNYMSTSFVVFDLIGQLNTACNCSSYSSITVAYGVDEPKGNNQVSSGDFLPHLSQYTVFVVVAPVVFFLGICCWIISMQSRCMHSLALTYLCVPLFSACVMFSDLYYLLFAYYYSYRLLLVSAIFVLLPNVQFIVVLYDSRVFPHPLIDYYPGKIASDRGYTYKFWFWLSHDQGSPLINRQQLTFTFEHHDSLPKVFVFVVSWLVLIALQLLCLTPYLLYLAVIMPYYAVMLLIGCFLFQTKLLAYTPVWNTYMHLLSGKVNVYDKRGIEYDTSLLNESLFVQLLVLSTAQVVLKAVNIAWLGQDYILHDLSLYVSVIAVFVGVCRFVVTNALLALNLGSLIAIIEALGLPKGTYDIRINSESIDLRKSYVLSTLLPYEIELASIRCRKVIQKCFMKQFSDIIRREIELFNSLRQLNMRPLHDGIEESIATRVFEMLLQDSIDLTMYRYLKSSGITKPKNLIGVSAATIHGIVSRLNNRSIKKLVDKYLRLISSCLPVGVRDVVIWLMRKCNGTSTVGNTKTLKARNRMTQQLSDIESNNKCYQTETTELVGVPSAHNFGDSVSPGDEAVDGTSTVGNTKTLGASNRMTQQLSDIESNKCYQIELVGVPSAHNNYGDSVSTGGEVVDGGYGDAALHGEPTISNVVTDGAITSGAGNNNLNVAQNRNDDSSAAPSVSMRNASRSFNLLIDLFRASPNKKKIYVKG